MSYQGDHSDNQTVRFDFNTVDADGDPITFAGTPSLQVHKDGGDTESTAGITLTVDRDGDTGSHRVAIVTTDAFYSTGSDFSVSVAAGTVDGKSMIGIEVGSFSIENRYMRGTESAALASVCTEARLAELDAANLPTDISDLNDLSTGDIDARLAAIHLDHLFAAAHADVAVAQSYFARLLSATGVVTTFDPATDSLEAIKDSAVAAVIQWAPAIPESVELGTGADHSLGIVLTNQLGVLPTTAQITPGTISIDRKPLTGTVWTSVVADEAMTEVAGLVSYLEDFDAATGYVAGDSLRITFKSIAVVVGSTTHEICGSGGIIYETFIRENMRGTNSAATAADLATAQTDITAILGDTNELQGDWVNGGRLDLLLDQVITDIAALNDVSAADVWDLAAAIDSYTPREVMRVLLAASAGKLSGVLTNLPKFRDQADTKDRISATTTTDGRTAVTIDAT